MSAAESSIDALMASAATEARAEDLVDHSEMDYDSLKAQISGVLGALNVRPRTNILIFAIESVRPSWPAHSVVLLRTR